MTDSSTKKNTGAGTAPATGTVKAFCYTAGEQVADGAALVEFQQG